MADAPIITEVRAFSRRLIFTFADGTEQSVPFSFPSGNPNMPGLGFGGSEPNVKDIVGLGPITVEDRLGIFFINSTGGGGGDPGGADTELQYNNAGAFGGIPGITTNGINMFFADNVTATFGDGNDLVIFHNGTVTRLTNNTGNFELINGTGDFVIDVTGITGKIINQLGTDNSNTEFTIRNNSNVDLLTTKGSGDVGIGISIPDSKLHVHTGTAGPVTPIANTIITAEGTTDAFISILGGAANKRGIVFGDDANNQDASIIIDGSVGLLEFIHVGTRTMTMSSAGNVAIGDLESVSSKLHVQESAVGTNPTGGVVIAAERNGNCFLSLMSSNASSSAVIFANAGNANAGSIRYNVGAVPDGLEFRVNNNVTVMALDSTGALGLGITSPAVTAITDLTSTTRGFLKPRMTTTQRDLIASPATGLEIYNTTTNNPEFFDGTDWITLTGASQTIIAKKSLGKVTLTGSQATITFDNIDQTFDRLFIKGKARSSDAVTASSLDIEINNDATAANYGRQRLFGENGVIDVGENHSSQSISLITGASASANSFGKFQTEIDNYSSTTDLKDVNTILSGIQTEGGNLYTGLQVLSWDNIAAITKIVLSIGAGGNFVAGTEVELWGEKEIIVAGTGGGATVASVVRLAVPDGYGSTNTKILRYPTPIINDGSDLTLAQSATLGDSVTINTAGSYTITLIADPDTASSHWGISVNSTQLTTNIQDITAADRISSIRIPDLNLPTSQTMSFKFAQNDVIRAHTDGTAFGSFNNLAVFQVLGPL